MATTPTTEPTSLTAGDSVRWQRALPDYPAPGYVLKYRLINADGKIDITASADGTSHLIEVAPATSSAWTAGTYSWAAWVEATGERHTVATGTLQIMPNVANMVALDNRSLAAKVVDQLAAAYLSYTASSGHIAEYTINGRTLKYRSSAEILEQLNYWKGQLAAEQRAQRIAAGLGAGNTIRVRF